MGNPIDDDQILVKRAQNGDKEVFDKLVLKYQNRALNIALGLMGNYEDAKDIAQEAFVKAYISIKNFRGQSKFFTWFYRILVNLGNNRLRFLGQEGWFIPISIDKPITTQEGEEISFEIPDTSSLPRKLLEKKEQKEQIQRIIDSLKPIYREAIVLHHIQELSYEEMAQILNLPIGTVKIRTHRAIMKLRELKESLKDML